MALTRVVLVPAAVAGAVVLASCGQADKLIIVSSKDAKVNAAIAEARATLPVFWQRYDDQTPGVTNYQIKAGLPTPHGGVEHIWIDVVNHSKLAVRGTLANDPVDLGDLKFGSEITVEPEKISDWMYERNGKIYGAYTVRALTDRANPEDQRRVAPLLSSTPLEAGAH